ncbi:MAG: peptide deformylase [Bacteroidales bacterium]|nr:peptide deformylase [Bacteroidales bacterium]
MVLPVTAYGHPVLRKISKEIDKDYPNFKELIDNMFETMYFSKGVGLAAPQVNLSIRLFIVDASPFAEEMPETKDFKKVIINPKIVEEKGEEWIFNEGCLSVPDIREDISRKPNIHIQYYDENFEYHDKIYDGILARIIQHEYDHLKGILFIDRVSNLRKMLLKRRLSDISKGNINVSYKMIFPIKKKKFKK